MVGTEHYSVDYSLQLSGGKTATTVAGDTSACVALDWMFAGKRAADAVDLVVEYNDGSGWATAFTWTGTGAADAEFFLHGGTITDSNAFFSAFELRLQSTGAGTDASYINDFVLRCWSDY